MQDLRLPEPARTVWLETRDLVANALRTVDPQMEYRLGGGTILSARWDHHRTSFDVDIQVKKNARLEDLTKPEYEWFRDRLTELGATTAYSHRANLFNIRFGQPPTENEVQLWGHELLIPEAHRRERVEGREETVLSTAAILRGKNRAVPPQAGPGRVRHLEGGTTRPGEPGSSSEHGFPPKGGRQGAGLVPDAGAYQQECTGEAQEHTGGREETPRRPRQRGSHGADRRAGTASFR